MLELFGARSSLSETAERFVRILLPVVVTASLLAFVHYLWNGSSADQALLGALSLLVAACPCAVGLAMPLAYAFTCREAARRGVLLRDSASVEALARARIMAFDKTGTLTCGQMRIVSIQTRHGGRTGPHRPCGKGRGRRRAPHCTRGGPRGPAVWNEQRVRARRMPGDGVRERRDDACPRRRDRVGG